MLIFLKISVFPLLVLVWFHLWFVFLFVCCFVFFFNSLEESEKMLTKKQNLFIIFILEGVTGGGDTSF